MSTKIGAYRVLVGINYRPTPKADEQRAEPGDLVDDVPAKTAKEWLAAGVLGDPAGDYIEGEGPDGSRILIDTTGFAAGSAPLEELGD